jgi:hypothetical protein
MAPLTERWVAIEGSIYTEAEHEQKTAGGLTIRVRHAIAYNVGDAAAQHIVTLHNSALVRSSLQAAV